MKIGVISDTHGSLTAWQQALAGPFADVDFIIHTGDATTEPAIRCQKAMHRQTYEAINACKLPIRYRPRYTK